MKTVKVIRAMVILGVFSLGVLTSCTKGGKTDRDQVQNFSLIDIEPSYTADEVQYDVKVFFTQPLEEEDALKVFNTDFVQQYGVTAEYLGERRYSFKINNVKRGRSDANIEMVLDGKPFLSGFGLVKKYEETSHDA